MKEIKNIVTFSLIIFSIVVIGIFGFSAFKNPITNTTITNQTTITQTGGITKTIVAKHSSANDCWMIISNKVYNLTNYIPIHPGGSGQVIPFCGKDATIAFDTKGGRGSHSRSAVSMLINYYVGNLGK